MSDRREPTERFWSFVEKTKTCWLWTGVPEKTGYARIRVRRPDGSYEAPGAHRYSWELHNEKIPKGMHVLHKCDVRTCVNPAHLWIGTNKDNANDRAKKGRSANQKGERGNNARLKEKDVRAIRAACSKGTAQRQVARTFKISFQHVSRIVKGLTWSHV